ncbi:Transposable element P transposase [Frankliniella fusca]|uniref:Transposable element P transposase n=1 Tax=Frankliniella fusca TaxID=407009 RepID=A0AAE1GS40_9NEOP|nr:Transposable element P transposase [Frankliniella fusca]
MPDRCIVFGCKTGYDSELRKNREDGVENPSLFTPKKEQLEHWRKKIPVPPEKVHLKSPVCEVHFEKQFIIDKHTINIGNVVIEEKRKKKALTPDAVPTIFPNCPKYCSVKVPKKRKSVSKQVQSPSKRRRVSRSTEKTLAENVTVEPEELNTASTYPDTCFLAALHKDTQKIRLPNSMWAYVSNDNSTIFIGLTLQNSNEVEIEKRVEFPNLTQHPLVSINKVKINIEREFNSSEAVASFLKEINDLESCPGCDIDDARSAKCVGYVKKTLVLGKPVIRCKFCSIKRHALQKQQSRCTNKVDKYRMKIKSVNNKKRYLSKKVQRLEDKVEACMKKLNDLKESQVKEILDKLPSRQQEAVQACISAAKAKKPNGRRYTQQWIYECTLLRIKSCSLYRKMLRDQTLALPSLRTLQRYLKKMKPAYGFIPATFELLSKKGEEMQEDEKHGCLLFDEMSLTSALSFNKSSLKVDGFVNLGDYTPSEMKEKPGDHALVFMYKPFKGHWFQTVAAFLSKGAVDGPILSKLSLEATALIEQAGFKVDMWVCDGAPWNRVMWTEMGIKNPFAYKRPSRAKGKQKQKESENTAFETLGNQREPVGLPHPCVAGRKIYMCSDFPHLIKRLKSRICPNEKGATRDLKTPDGMVKFSHWQALLEADSDKAIQVCHKLSKDHLYPHNYQTMNVGMAFSFFSKDVADAMEHYRDEGVKGLADCGSTVAFIRKINDLVDAMNANTPWGSIRKETPCPPTANSTDATPGSSSNQTKYLTKNAREIIENFISYLIRWHEMPGKVAEKIPSQTHYGLYVTLCSAIEVSNYLIDEIGFEYVMTRRMNQDSLENFFGGVRQACGCNTHPDPVQFIQIYRLLSVASLVKPPRGSNITGAEMLQSLLSTHDVMSDKEKERHIQFESELDSLLDEGETIGAVDDLLEDSLTEGKTIDEKALRFFCGYVARKARRATIAKTCEECFEGLQDPHSTHQDNSLIDRKSHGGLLKPSEPLYNVIYKLETVIINTLLHCELHEDILERVVTNAQKYSYCEIGCETHNRELTKAVIRFYLTTRMIFACKQFNKKKNENADKRKKMKALVKQLHVIPS